LLSAPAKKSFSSVRSSISACSIFKSTGGAGSATEQRGCPVKHLSRPCRDLVAVNVVLPRQTASVFSPLMAATAALALKAECASDVPVAPLSRPIRGILTAIRQIFHLSTCPNLPSHLYPEQIMSAGVRHDIHGPPLG
jgi:hypothetical protein